MVVGVARTVKQNKAKYYWLELGVLQVGWIAILLGLSSAAFADLRVLVSFDGDVHSISQTFGVVSSDLPESELVAHSRIRRQSEWQTEKVAHRVAVSWFDAQGVRLLQHYINDPRVAHAPHQEMSVEQPFQYPFQYIGHLSGSYLLSGPDGATQVVLQFPQLLLSDSSLSEQVIRLSLSR